MPLNISQHCQTVMAMTVSLLWPGSVKPTLKKRCAALVVSLEAPCNPVSRLLTLAVSMVLGGRI